MLCSLRESSPLCGHYLLHNLSECQPYLRQLCRRFLGGRQQQSLLRFILHFFQRNTETTSLFPPHTFSRLAACIEQANCTQSNPTVACVDALGDGTFSKYHCDQASPGFREPDGVVSGAFGCVAVMFCESKHAPLLAKSLQALVCLLSRLPPLHAIAQFSAF